MSTQTHIVIKIEDAQAYLNPKQLDDLTTIARTIESKRLTHGKRLNAYIIVNEDEPYAGIVKNVVLLGERRKKERK